MRVFKAPEDVKVEGYELKIFMAGSIEMGKAENWQERLTRELEGLPVCLINPRRDDWDSTWVQSIDNPQFNTQVNWELDHITSSDIVVFVFDPSTMSPITLLELGYVAGLFQEAIIMCPEGFWRKGNVDVLVSRCHQIQQVHSMEELVDEIKNRVSDFEIFLF